MWDIVAGARGNFTEYSWQAEPNYRGTFGIISTCFLTLAICTFKIVVLNIQGVCPEDDLPWSAWWRKGTTNSMRHRLVHILGGHQITRQIGWLLIGLFAPELIAFAAFRQYWDVRSLQSFMEHVYLQTSRRQSWWTASRGQSRASSADIEQDISDKPVWTTAHSWYAVMGGYSYNLQEGGKVYLPDDHGRQQLILRDEALRLVAEHEPTIIPNLSVTSILDKSSSTAFVKIITLFQALWFSLQCILRMCQGLSLSLLELTTFAHCMVALLIGWLWLEKPMDIQQPDPLEMPKGQGPPHWLMAMLYSLSSFDGEDSDEDRFRRLSPGERLRMANAELTESRTYLDATINQDPMTFSNLDLNSARPESSSVPEARPVTGGLSRPNTSRLTPASALAHLYSSNSILSTSTAPSLSELVQACAERERRFRIRIQLAQKGWNYYILKKKSASEADGSTTGTDISRATTAEEGELDRHVKRRLKQTLSNTLVDRVTNFPRQRHDHPKGQHTFRTHLGITLTGFLYGGLHLLAWDASFTTQIEANVWRIAALSIACSGLLVPITHAEGVFMNAVRPWLMMDEDDRDAEEAEHLAEKKKRMGPRRGWRRYWWVLYKWSFLWMIEVFRVLKVAILVVVALIYIGFRVFIFAECLVNVSHLPPSAFETVNWSRYVPHIN